MKYKFSQIGVPVLSIAFVALIVVGYWMYMVDREVVADYPVPSSAVLHKNDPYENKMATSSEDTSTWKTYRNEEYGFEFMYPGYLGDLIGSNKDIISLDCDSNTYNEISLRSPSNLSIQYICESAIYDNPDRVNKETITAGGRNGYYASYMSSTGYYNQDVYLPYKDGYYIALNHSYKIGRSDYVELTKDELEKILSTFKFTK